MKNKSFSFFFSICFILKTSILPLQAQLPIINSFYPFMGYVGSLVIVKGSNLNNPTAIIVGGINAIIISYSDTQAVAMVMPGAVTGLLYVTTPGGTSSGKGNFIINASQPPIKQLGGKLYDASNQTAGNSGEEGFSVAMSADGNTAVAGGDFDNGDAGAIWIYTRTNNVWTQQAKLAGTGATGTTVAQGYSTAISADGSTIIEGGVGDNGFRGAAWIFTRDNNGTWSQQGNKLVGSGSIIVGNTTPEQGYSVGISADGNTAVIGGRRDNNYIGAAWVFTRSNGTWSEEQKMVPTGYIPYKNVQGTQQYHGVQAGSSVAISADGATAFMGGPNDNNDTGAVWVFTRNGNVWAQQGSKLVGTVGNRSFYGGIQQGTSVAGSADGNTVIIGAPFDMDSASTDNTANYANGSVWIFTRSANTWTQQGNKLFATDASLGAEQGWSVSISADGNTVIVGGPTDSVYTGGAWIYTRTNNVWKQSSNKLLGTGYVGGAKQGWSSSISADGNTAIVGGPEDYYQHQGAAWVYVNVNSGTLPVTIANFKAFLSGSGIQTKWDGYDETDLRSYDMERSEAGVAFGKIGNVSLKANTLRNTYYWYDPLPLAGNNFYRVKAISKDGGVQYSSIIKINAGYLKSSIEVYPNPVYNKTISLRLNNVTPGNYIIEVYNTLGQAIYYKSFQHTGGEATVAINLNNVPAGVYHIVLKGTNNKYFTKVMMR